MSLGKFKEALRDYEYVRLLHLRFCRLFINLLLQVTKARPTDKDAKLKYTECNKIVKKIAFEKAISVEDKKKNIADSIDLEAMSRYPSYIENFSLLGCKFQLLKMNTKVQNWRMEK